VRFCRGERREVGKVRGVRLLRFEEGGSVEVRGVRLVR
jgi:hypothetical protein